MHAIRIRPNLAIATIMMMIAASPIFAVGTVNQTISPIGRDPGSNPDNRVHQLAINWTADASVGTVPVTTLNLGAFPAIQGMRLVSVEIKPGTPAPTNLYSVTLTDSLGIDLLGGTGLSLSNTTATSTTITNLTAPMFGGLTFTLTGNSVNSATGTVYAYFAPLAQTTITTGSPTLTGANTFTGTNAFTGTVTAGNFNNIRIVDGLKFAQSAAGINAADADLGAGVGEIWVPTGAAGNNIIATDAQISISQGHTLKIFGSIVIDAVNKGPILVNKYSKVWCQNNGGTGQGNIIQVNGGGSATSMLRFAVQDGSLETFYEEGCSFNGQGVSISRGMIDVTGMNDKGRIINSILFSFTGAGAAIYMDENSQAGINAGSSTSIIEGNWLQPGAGSGGCLYVKHNATNSAILQEFQFINNECQLAAGSSTIANSPILFQNLSAGGGNLRGMKVDGFYIQGVPAAQPSITINGLQSSSFRNISCSGASTTCISVSNNAVTTSVMFDNINLFTGTNIIVDNVASPARTITNPTLSHYEVWLSTAPATQLFEIPVNSQIDRLGVAQTTDVTVSTAGLKGFYAGNNTNNSFCNQNGAGNGFVCWAASNSNVPLFGGNIVALIAAANTWSAIQSFNSGDLLPSAAGGTDLGSTSLPFGNAWLGTAATNNFKVQPGTTTGARVITITDPVSPTTVGLPLTIASGTATMTTALIASQACGTVVTVAATGVATTDSIYWNDNAQPAAATNGVLPIKAWPTSGNVNFFYCNPTAAGVTPAAATLNWRVAR